MVNTAQMLERCRKGDQEASRRLFDAFVSRLLPLVQARLSNRLAGRLDAEDVVQSVFRTFFRRLQESPYQLRDENDLLRLLVRITINKTLKHVERNLAAKRDPYREVTQDANRPDRWQRLMTTHPTPAMAAEFVDELEHFLVRLSPTDRQIVELRLHGYSTTEVARKLRTYDRKVRRVLERVRAIAEHEGLAG